MTTTEKKPHWTQTEAGKKRMSQIQKLAHAKMREVKKIKHLQKKGRATTLVINGWRVTLGKNEVVISND